MTPDAPIDVRRRGAGPTALLVHGAAADGRTWTLAAGALAGDLTTLAYDRRVAAGLTTEAHADDAVAILRRELAPGARALVAGSSFGAVVSLEIAARAPELVAGLVLGEPPLPAGPHVPSAPFGFGCAFDRLVATAGGPAAAELFLRSVLGDTAWGAVPPFMRAQLCATWPQIRADMTSLARYRVDPQHLCTVTAPALLLTGSRSPAFLEAGVELLAAVLPAARRDVVPGAGHAMHIEAPRAYAERVRRFARDIGHLG
ncbi:MAG TPA: alpha/beta hydrolase [Kofleriaceae bacterium]|nr:alpha/beta hydrolase [Kofleriaceae bacterium]